MESITKTDRNGNHDLYTIEVSGSYYHQTFTSLEDVVRYCNRYGIPVPVFKEVKL